MGHDGPQLPYRAADTERKDFISFVPFFSENFRQYLLYLFSSYEDGDSSLLECAKALNSLENAIAGYFFTSSNVLTEDIGNAWYDLAQKLLGYAKPETFIFKDCYTDDIKELTSRILAFTSVVGIQGNLPKLPNGYWNIHEMKDLETIYPNIQPIMSHSHSGKKDRLLLVTGEPGCGKTNLMLQFTRRMMRRQPIQGNAKETGVIAYFFNHGNTIEDCISSVVRQLKRLAEGDLDFRNPTSDIRHEDPTSDIRHEDPTANIRHENPTFDMMISTLCHEIEKKFRSIYIVIDGLDDCFNPDDDETAPRLQELLELIFSTIELSEETNCIISCRSFDKSLIPPTFEFYELNLNDEKELGKPAMNLISIQLNAFFRRKGIQDSFRKKVESDLLKKSKGNLLWIKLACSILERDPKNAFKLADRLEAQIEDLLDTLEAQVEDLYTREYEQLKITAEEEAYLEKVITTMIATYQPLSISELRSLAALPDGYDWKQLIRKRFTFFLEVREDIVYFSHRSSKEFLLKRYNHDGKAMLQRHAEIALQCLRTLVSSDYETNVSRNTSYCSSSHWVKHLVRSKFVSDIDTRRSSLNVALMDFLNRGFTRWLSAMSKTSHPFSRANRHLLRLRDYLTSFIDQKTPLDDIIVSVLDAVRFHIFHDNVSMDCPMYSRNDDSTVRPKDSLLFYPFNGFKLQLLKKEFPQLLNVPPTEYNVNDMVINIRFPSEVFCFAYSPDGRFLASPLPLFEENNADVCIWDAYTGTCIGILRTPALYQGSLRRIAFSASGELARAHGSAIDGYNLSTRTHIEGFPQKGAGKYLHLKDLTFSPDGKHLAFSPKRQWLAADLWKKNADEGTDNRGEIKVWDINSGELVHTFSDLDYSFSQLSFSFDGTRLAAEDCYYKIIIIWNLDTGHFDTHGFELMEYENTGSRELFRSMEFSPKDFNLAALFRNTNEKKHGKLDGQRQWWSTIRIWDASAFEDGANKSLVQTDGHTHAIHCVKFSHNGKFFATADCDGKICIWDGETGNYQASFESKSRDYGDDILLLISPDDRSLAACSIDAELIIWDTATWSQRQKLTGHKKKVSCAVFSPDGKRLVSASYDRPDKGDETIKASIQIWDVHGSSNTDKIVETESTGGTEIAEKRVPTCMAFSPDGTQLACCADTIKIWNLSPGGSLNILQQLDFHRTWRNIPYSIFFSQDAEFIIGSGYNHLSLWKIESEESKECARSIDVEMRFQSLKWDPADPQYIFTDLGPYYIGEAFDTRLPEGVQHVETPPATSPTSTSCTLQTDGSGIHWKGKSLVKFPDRYRPLVWDNSLYMASIHGKKVALGFESGHVTLLNFEG
ncbi:hypothetical protein GGI42DRAFT_366735 [Trichoderma sp. SZMC 28013]